MYEGIYWIKLVHDMAHRRGFANTFLRKYSSSIKTGNLLVAEYSFFNK